MRRCSLRKPIKIVAVLSGCICYVPDVYKAKTPKSIILWSRMPGGLLKEL